LDNHPVVGVGDIGIRRHGYVVIFAINLLTPKKNLGEFGGKLRNLKSSIDPKMGQSETA